MFDRNEAQAAAELDVTPRQLATWRKAGLIPFVRTPGGRIGYTLAMIETIRARCMHWPDDHDIGVFRREG